MNYNVQENESSSQSPTSTSNSDPTQTHALGASISKNLTAHPILNSLKKNSIIDELDKVPCVLDVLNHFVKDIVTAFFIQTNTDYEYLTSTLLDKKINPQLRAKVTDLYAVFKNMSKVLISTLKQNKSPVLLTNICNIKKNCHYLPKWCQQFILLKRMFKIDSIGCKSFSHSEIVLVKEFIDLFDPLYSIIIELTYQPNISGLLYGPSTISKVYPCLRTALATYKNLILGNFLQIKYYQKYSKFKVFNYILRSFQRA